MDVAESSVSGSFFSSCAQQTPAVFRRKVVNIKRSVFFIIVLFFIYSNGTNVGIPNERNKFYCVKNAFFPH